MAHRGFEAEFLNQFDTVCSNHGCACSTALNERSRIVVADVGTDRRFSDDSRGVLLRANVRSVQSTPLIEPSGRFVGMVSTHYSRPKATMPHMWKQVDDLAASFLAEINT